MSLALLLLLSGCEYGPKGSPDGTVEAFFDAANDKDFAGMTRMLAPESIKRIGNADKMQRYLAASYDGWQDFQVEVKDVRLNIDGVSGVVVYSCSAKVFNIRTRKLDPGKCDDLYSVQKNQDDGKWYIVLPESQKLKPML